MSDFMQEAVDIPGVSPNHLNQSMLRPAFHAFLSAIIGSTSPKSVERGALMSEIR